MGDLRVAMVVPGFGGGGSERAVRDLCVALPKHGVTPGVFSIGGLDRRPTDLLSAGISVMDCSESAWRIRGVNMKLLRTLRSFRPNVVHAHSGAWLPAAVAKTLLGIGRLVFTDHGRYSRGSRARALIERWCMGRTNCYVAVSESLAAYVRGHLGLNTAAVVVSNGIGLSAFHQPTGLERTEVRAELGVSDEDVVAIAVGRLVAVKNHGWPLDVRASAVERAPRLQCVLAGKGWLGPRLRAMVTELGLGAGYGSLGF